MACCTVCDFDPCQCGCGGFTELSGMDVNRTLVKSLIPCVDQIRDLYTCLGARAYEVALVRTRWSEGERGCGVEEVIQDTPILPTPLIGDLTQLSLSQESIGTEEVGTLEIEQISARFTEEELLGEGPNGEPVPDDEQFYWEVRMFRANDRPLRRRFYPDSAPNQDPLKFQWTITLQRAYENRLRSGEPQG